MLDGVYITSQRGGVGWILPILREPERERDGEGDDFVAPKHGRQNVNTIQSSSEDNSFPLGMSPKKRRATRVI